MVNIHLFKKRISILLKIVRLRLTRNVHVSRHSPAMECETYILSNSPLVKIEGANDKYFGLLVSNDKVLDLW